ncbi:MAG: aromatic-ring-hydroxylating dioxygenase subunit beta [Candidatus Carbobacillus altaicus]|uniref:3-phenylpropionate dioxygenase beta subunit n=1 Tax=Candidatus Carbonibacillus altaicus TaxID=2163959 RepID=A0A2R6XXC5_9BACL|nr:aromatic-ring-hydroxylating dioxygenase subunit beta [Candidatus Carbobacillus altaicus]PTQ55073.1 MAG: 3-phenylpropionate dioxygenase beta subunit [Candidatus Carbobacillus altaicus]
MAFAQSADPQTYLDIVQFLHYEASLLDNGQFREWVNVITEDVLYRVPLRVTREREHGAGFVPSMYHYEEDRDSLEMRVLRLETEAAWAEDPPSRTRHLVSNIRVETIDEMHVRVFSNILLFRSRGESAAYDFLSGERIDILRKEGDGWKIKEREVRLDMSSIPMHNLAILL